MAHLQKINNSGVSRQVQRDTMFHAALQDINGQTLLPRRNPEHSKVTYSWSRNLRRSAARNYVRENWGE